MDVDTQLGGDKNYIPDGGNSLSPMGLHWQGALLVFLYRLRYENPLYLNWSVDQIGDV